MRTLVLSLAVLALLPSALAAAPLGGQRWFPSDALAGGDFVAHRGAPQGEPAVLLAPTFTLFQADEPAAVALDFHRAPWAYGVRTAPATALAGGIAGSFQLALGFTVGSSVTLVGFSGFLDLAACASGCTGTITPNADLAIPQGGFLTLEVDAAAQPDGQPSAPLWVNHADTWIESPASGPDYPVPELGTLALALAGLGAVAAACARRG